MIANWTIIITLKCSRQARSKAKAPFFFVFKQNLNPSYWQILCIKNYQKWSRIENVMAPQIRGGQELKKINHQNATKTSSQTPTKFLICCSITIRAQRWFVDFRWHSYSTLNRLKWIRNKNVMRFESRKGPKWKKRKKKNMFCKLENLFLFLLFFHYSFAFALQRWFLELEVTFPKYFKSLKMKDIWWKYK